MQEQQAVKVGIDVGDGMVEWLFAEPVGDVAADGSGLYRLVSTAVLAPFLMQDVVYVDRLRVVGLQEESDCVAYAVRFLPQMTAWQKLELAQRWLDADAYIGRYDENVWVVTVLPDGVQPTVYELDALQDDGYISYFTVRDGDEDLSVWPPAA